MIKKWTGNGIKEGNSCGNRPIHLQGCYTVDDRVINEMEIWLDDSVQKPYNEISPGQYALDLKEMNHLILKKTGIPAGNIGVTQFCTSCRSDQFFLPQKRWREDREDAQLHWLERRMTS